MKTVYKYQILSDMLPVEMPSNSLILKADFQDEKLFIWMLVETSNPNVQRTFTAYGTGHEIDDKVMLKPIDTAFMDNGLVFHVFEIFQ